MSYIGTVTTRSDLSRANELNTKAKEAPEKFSREEMEALVEITRGEHREARTKAAGAIDRLFMYPGLYEPVLAELIEYSAYYPHGVEGIPAPIEWQSDEYIREVVVVADAVARVTQRRPELLVPHTDRLTEIVTNERNSPKYHLFTLGTIGGIKPDAVPLGEVQSQLCDLLDTSTNGYAGWAADTLRRIGDPNVLPELRDHAPEDLSDATDEAEIEAFEDAIEELEDTIDDR